MASRTKYCYNNYVLSRPKNSVKLAFNTKNHLMVIFRTEKLLQNGFAISLSSFRERIAFIKVSVGPKIQILGSHNNEYESDGSDSEVIRQDNVNQSESGQHIAQEFEFFFKNTLQLVSFQKKLIRC